MVCERNSSSIGWWDTAGEWEGEVVVVCNKANRLALDGGVEQSHDNWRC